MCIWKCKPINYLNDDNTEWLTNLAFCFLVTFGTWSILPCWLCFNSKQNHYFICFYDIQLNTATKNGLKKKIPWYWQPIEFSHLTFQVKKIVLVGVSNCWGTRLEPLTMKLSQCFMSMTLTHFQTKASKARSLLKPRIYLNMNDLYELGLHRHAVYIQGHYFLP